MVLKLTRKSYALLFALIASFKLFYEGKVSEETLAEEEQLNDLLLLIKLLSSLLTKDNLDFGSGQLTCKIVLVHL